MENIIESLRDILGTPDFYIRLEGSNNYSWDYGAMLEYMIGGVLVCIIVAGVFKLLRGWSK